MNDIGTLWFALAVCVFGTLQATRNIYRGRQSRQWSVVEAEVIRSYLRGGFALPYFPVVRYEYQFRGEQYRRSRIAFAHLQIPSRRAANEFLAQFPPGARVTVRLHPTRPGISVIRAGDRLVNWVELTVGILMGAFVASRLF